MQRLSPKRIAFATAVLAAGLAPALAAKDGATDAMPARTEMTYDGPVLVTASGMALYTHGQENTKAPKFAWQCDNVPPALLNDQQSGIGERPQIGVKLVKSCIQKFPPYVADGSAQPVGDFTIVERPDGTKQWAYRGYPLYLSIKDRAPGQRNAAGGGGFGGGGGRFGRGMGFASIPMTLPAGLKLSRMADGLVVTATAGDKPLYTPRPGARMRLASAGGDAFQPIVAPAIAQVSGEWSIIDAGPGVKQYAFRGKPLYAAPAGMNEAAVAESGGWDPIVVAKNPSRPATIGEHLTLLGEVYTDKNGRTLYTYNCNAGPGQGGVSVRASAVPCDDSGDPAAFMVALCGDGKECARRWRPYLAPANAKPEGEFSIVDITYPMFTDMKGALYPADAPRVKAWAYRGKPLFTYYEDEKPGDIWGSGIGGIWGSTFTALQVPGKNAVSFEF